MSTMFKFTPAQLDTFNNYLKMNKEVGGVMNIQNNNITNITKSIGNDYSVMINEKNSSYEISYHTHAYSKQKKNVSRANILNIINVLINKNKLDDALYLFECDIMKIHPPSPQDVYICSRGTKQGMLIITQEGIYELYYKGATPISTETKKLIDEKYYKCMWGRTLNDVHSELQSGNNDKLFGCLKKCNKHRHTHSPNVSINSYLNYIKKFNLFCKLTPWHKCCDHVFFS